ncbi:hypothetical protein MNBD_ALPHA11-677 [hydrothermal vent metagenome]|uniref:Uncharacterized protein n=1 Tax=hydrothermal vent metagenome TaxID=652676 RepID=A0A3B0TMX5_9ZZZZ
MVFILRANQFDKIWLTIKWQVQSGRIRFGIMNLSAKINSFTHSQTVTV